MAAMVQVLSVKPVAGLLQPSTRECLQKQGNSQVSRRCYVVTASSTPECEVSRRNAVLGLVGASALSLLSLEPALAGTSGARVVNPELRKKMREELERIKKENSNAKASTSTATASSLGIGNKG